MYLDAPELMMVLTNLEYIYAIVQYNSHIHGLVFIISPTTDVIIKLYLEDLLCC